MSEECNSCDILGINEGISKDKELLKKVLRKLIRIYRPDQVKDEGKKKEYNDITEKITAAHDKLLEKISDVNEKSSYNKNLVEFIIKDIDNNKLFDVNIKARNDKTENITEGMTKTCNVGSFFLDLPEGKHVIEFKKEGYKTIESKVTLKKKGNRKVERTLKKLNESDMVSDELELDMSSNEPVLDRNSNEFTDYYSALDEDLVEEHAKVHDELKPDKPELDIVSDDSELDKESNIYSDHYSALDEDLVEEHAKVPDESEHDILSSKTGTKIYVNGELVGRCDNPDEFVSEMREKRRRNEISNEMNITYYDKTSEISIWNDSGRARRPLIIVKDGIPLLEEEHIQQIIEGKITWDDLIKMGIVEYLDAEEEENSYISLDSDNLNVEHTHLEIDPSTILGICAGIIPFSNHNSSPRNTLEAGMVKQALGLYVSNYMFRTDTRAHLLHQPQTPIVKTRMNDVTNYDKRPAGQNFIVALLSFEGYNTEDSLILNKSSLERGLARSSFFRSYETFEKKYPGGQADKFEVPEKGIRGYRSEDAYRHLDEDGIINPESYVESGDVLIGKTSPPRFLEEIDEFGSTNEKRRETSVTVRNGEKGVVDKVILTETVEGNNLTKVRIRDIRQPELGDKFASRHGQKGVVGRILSQEDVPFTENGIVPDLIINPLAFPSRMSIGQILDLLAGKEGSIEGKKIDATPFTSTESKIKEIEESLVSNGFEHAGCESLYNGMTGERFDVEIFVGVAYYQKLHHMTTDKIYARSRGPVQVLTRQPTEGRAREGGLRFGEMERDCLIAHGSTLALKERLLDESDKYEAIVCSECGMLSVHDYIRNKIYCPICGEVESFPVEIAYAFKLLLDELKSLCIFPKLILEDKA